MNCISCQNTNFVKYFETSSLGLPVFVCSKCGLGVTGDSEKSVKEKISDLYSKNYWDKRNSEIMIKSNYSDIDSEGKRRNWISQYSYCKPYIHNKKSLLEIGSGGGQSIYWFEKEGYDVVGIEPDSRNVELINKKLSFGKCISGFAEDLEINGKYEIIWMSHVLEHMLNPVLFLKKIKKNLKPNGLFFIEVPNCENKKIFTNTVKTQPHTFHFTKKSLINIISQNEYKIIKSDYFRPATLIEGGVNRVLRILPQKKLFPYYPRILTSGKKGRDLRIIFTIE